jgi:FkbM family methyltransferase
MKDLIKTILRKLGFQLRRYPEKDLVRRIKLVKYFNIDTIFDIGANSGQYAVNMRQLGFKGKIISFEPMNEAFEVLKKRSRKDKNWIVNNYALGSIEGKTIINVAANSYSSSILKMLPTHINSAKESKYIKQEEIEIKKVDSVFNSFCTTGNSVMLKIDTQGYEKYVLEGASKSLEHILIIQLEMSIIPLYEDEMLYLDMISHLSDKGFQLFSLENGFSDQTTGELLQVDGLFVKKSAIDKFGNIRDKS